MSQHKHTLAIVDDHPIVIEGIKNLLSDHTDIEITGSFTNGRDFLDYFTHTPVQIVLLDITLPDIGGIDLCKEIKTLAADTVVIAFSNHNERSMIMKMLQNGASGYLLKNASSAELINCIHEAIEGRITFSASIQEIISRPQIAEIREIPMLTRRENEILKLIASGKTTVDIATDLFLSKLTIETHRRNLLQKFGVRNVAQLISTATQLGVL
ncbi:response regulator [Pedobacter sp. AW31-3R]|uniref:response regulator n=1 Tax=Pedobacter sp. AW31-3R TaxID=3445781 RepID=UPI003FA07F85